MSKSETISFRISDDDYKKLMKNLKLSGMKKSDYLRKLFHIKNTKVIIKTMDPEVREELLKINYNLSKMGTNINQIAHLCNSEKNTTAINLDDIAIITAHLASMEKRMLEILRKVQ